MGCDDNSMDMHWTKIVFETAKHFVKRVPKGFEVYAMGPTAATRVATIGYQGDKGLQRAKYEVERREKQ